jgi:hypothetical protein
MDAAVYEVLIAAIHQRLAGNELIGNQELESWLLMHLQPRLNFSFATVNINDLPLVVPPLSR